MGEKSVRKAAIIIVVITIIVAQHQSAGVEVKRKVFVSEEIVLEPGLVSNKNYYAIDFPRGHIGLKSLDAELVDDRGNPVSLHDTYLHHWVISRYYAPINTHTNTNISSSTIDVVRNGGICDDTLKYYYGVGAETRRTVNDIPHPYAIQVGDPATIPPGYEEGWALNVHAIDTRGAENMMGCAECRCDLYDVDQQTVPSGYQGGLGCCRNDKRCRLKQGFRGHKRSLYLRYTVQYVDWDSRSMIPVTIYVLDVTDVWTKGDESKGIPAKHDCAVEYDVERCDVGVEKNGCVDTKSTSFSFPKGGDMIYGVGHQHAGAIATTLYGEGGRTICSSIPIYGQGNEAGNEAGYIVGMTTCYPSTAGPVKISAGETLTIVANYSSVERHTGVMSLFYLLLADSSPTPRPPLAYKITEVPNFVWPIVLLGAVFVVLVGVLAWRGKIGKTEGYEAII